MDVALVSSCKYDVYFDKFMGDSLKTVEDTYRTVGPPTDDVLRDLMSAFRAGVCNG